MRKISEQAATVLIITEHIVIFAKSFLYSVFPFLYFLSAISKCGDMYGMSVYVMDVHAHYLMWYWYLILYFFMPSRNHESMWREKKNWLKEPSLVFHSSFDAEAKFHLYFAYIFNLIILFSIGMLLVAVLLLHFVIVKKGRFAYTYKDCATTFSCANLNDEHFKKKKNERTWKKWVKRKMRDSPTDFVRYPSVPQNKNEKMKWKNGEKNQRTLKRNKKVVCMFIKSFAFNND